MIFLHYLDRDSFTLSIIFYINIKFLACFSSTRVYEPPDPPGYFDGHVWPMYLKHRQEMNTITWEIGKYLPSFSQVLLLLIYVKVQKGLLGKHFSQGVCKEMLRQPRGSPHLQLDSYCSLLPLVVPVKLVKSPRHPLSHRCLDVACDSGRSGRQTQSLH